MGELTRQPTLAVTKVTKEKLEQLFDSLDGNHDGHISRTEIIKAMRKDSEVHSAIFVAATL